MCGTCAYLFSAIGSIFEIAGVIGLFAYNQKWIVGIEKTKSIGHLYVHTKNEVLSSDEKILEDVMENRKINMSYEQKVDDIIVKVEVINEVNKKLHSKSVLWLIAIILGSVAQLSATVYFLVKSF